MHNYKEKEEQLNRAAREMLRSKFTAVYFTVKARSRIDMMRDLKEMNE